MFKGSFVALVTPFTVSGDVDYEALIRLIHWHIDSGTHGLVPVGTTGESSTLSQAEHRRVLKVTVEEVDQRIPVIAGCGSNNSAESGDFHEYAYTIGATAALHVTGYYNKPSQEGIFRHFDMLANLNSLPIIVYNVPARAVVDIVPQTLAKIAQLDNVIGVKDATADLTRPFSERRLINGDFCQLSGEDGTAVAYNASGGDGCISVTANVAPALCAQMQEACLRSDFSQAMRIQEQLSRLHEALFIEPSPSGVKYACSRLNLCSDAVRLPLTRIGAKTRMEIDIALDGAGLI